MTIEFKDPVRRGGAVCITMVARVPVAEISLNGASFELHFHPLAEKLSADEFAQLTIAGKKEAARMNALGVQAHLDLFDIATRLTS